MLECKILTFPAWLSPVSAATVKLGCSAMSLTTSSPVYPLAPRTATRYWSATLPVLEPTSRACGTELGHATSQAGGLLGPFRDICDKEYKH